jgi:hypothetical protein
VPVNVWSSCADPDTTGAAVFFGAEPVACTTSVAREVAFPAPSLFDARTATRTRCPTSVVIKVYWRLFAPAIAVHEPASVSQLSH